MANPTDVEKTAAIASRFGAFVAERHPFALGEAIGALDSRAAKRPSMRCVRRFTAS
jgi:hypothetical protein